MFDGSRHSHDYVDELLRLQREWTQCESAQIGEGRLREQIHDRRYRQRTMQYQFLDRPEGVGRQAVERCACGHCSAQAEKIDVGARSVCVPLIEKRLTHGERHLPPATALWAIGFVPIEAWIMKDKEITRNIIGQPRDTLTGFLSL